MNVIKSQMSGREVAFAVLASQVEAFVNRVGITEEEVVSVLINLTAAAAFNACGRDGIDQAVDGLRQCGNAIEKATALSQSAAEPLMN